MLDGEIINEGFQRNTQIVHMQAKGLSHTDSLAQLPVRANCMNWIVGHLLTGRNNILKLLGAEPAVSPERIDIYQRESEPISADSPEVLPFDELMALLDQSQAAITAALATQTPADLAREVAFFGNRSMSVLRWLLFFHFHDTYHVGQTEIMRQAAGKDDKVI